MSVPKVLYTRALQLVRQPATSRGLVISAGRTPTILPADAPIEEEKIPGYDPKRFLPVNPGDILNNRYKIVVKVGWGSTSTVWLAQDTQRYVLPWSDAYSYILTDGGGTPTVT
jgi:hypothetical protein